MRRRRLTSIASYVANWFTVLLLFVFLILLVSVLSLSSTAARYDIDHQIWGELYHNRREVHISEDGEIKVRKHFEKKKDGMYFQVFSADGTLVYGQYPKGFEADIQEHKPGLQVVRSKADGSLYYVRDLPKSVNKVLVRCVVKKSDISTQYDKICLAALGLVPLMSIAFWFLRKLLEKQVNRPVKAICDKVVEIGADREISLRIEYDGCFQELRIFADANNRMLDQLEDMFENQKQFTSNAAHELRTPVAVMLAQCENVLAYGKTVEEYREAQEVIHRQATKMNRIIMQLLNLSRLEQNRMKLNFEPVELGEIVESVCEDEQITQEKEIHIETHIGTERVNADICLMTILIHNLVENAVKYSEANTKIRIWTEAEDGWLSLYVQDEGCGIPKEQLGHIMRRFYRVEETSEREGFGLGLPMVVMIAEKHGGRIDVQSTLGEGSTFQVLLPLADPQNNELPQEDEL